MSSEKQNKMPVWKERFLQWENTGGNAAEQENMLWEKLQDRLQPKQNRKKAFFFWAAAILILSLGGFLFFQQTSTQKKKDISITPPVNPLQKTVSKKEIATPVISTNNNNTIVAIKPVTRKLPVVNEPAFLPVEKVMPQEEPLIAITNAPEIIAPPIVNAAPPKNKFRIVHLNEWNSPPPPTYAALRDAWMEEQKIPTTLPEPSIWPGKNKTRPIITPENSITP